MVWSFHGATIIHEVHEDPFKVAKTLPPWPYGISSWPSWRREIVTLHFLRFGFASSWLTVLVMNPSRSALPWVKIFQVIVMCLFCWGGNFLGTHRVDALERFIWSWKMVGMDPLVTPVEKNVSFWDSAIIHGYTLHDGHSFLGSFK